MVADKRHFRSHSSESWHLIVKALKVVGLGHFVDRLDEDVTWEHTLSGGDCSQFTNAYRTQIRLAKADVVELQNARR